MQNEGNELQDSQEVKGFSKNRIEAFSDGIFAVALPLLILEIHPWEKVDLAEPDWWPKLWPLLASCVFGFLVVGIYWVAHHNEFDLIAKVNRRLLWLNMLFLLSVVFIPISAGLLGKYLVQQDSDREKQITIWAYAGNLIITGLLLNALWLYAKRSGNLRIQSDDRRIKATKLRNLIIPIGCTIAILPSFIAWSFPQSLPPSLIVNWGYSLFVATPITYILWTIRRRDRVSTVQTDPNEPECLLLFQHLWEELYGNTGPCEFRPADVEGEGSAFVVSRLGGRAVGCGAILRLGDRADRVAEVKRLFVEASARRHGIALDILRKLEDIARERGYKVMRLETGVRQPGAIRLYEAAGYQHAARYGPYVVDPLSVCFEKRLG